jgi:hypothetical protein
VEEGLLSVIPFMGELNATRAYPFLRGVVPTFGDKKIGNSINCLMALNVVLTGI